MNSIKCILAVALAVALTACGGGGGGDPSKPENPMADAMEREKWEKETQKKFDEATAAIEKSKKTIAKANKKSNAEAIATLSDAQTAIQEVAIKQKEVIGQFTTVFALLDMLGKENANLTKDKQKLEQEKSDLQSRERLFSMGFYASLGAAVLALATVLTKLPTAFLDRKYRRLELLEKRLEIRMKRREVVASISVARQASVQASKQ